MADEAGVSLQISREGRVRRLTLNRPEKRNALSGELCHALVSAMEDANNDRSVGAILVDAAGKVFCAGMDLEESLRPDAAAKTEIHEKLFTCGMWMRKPIVAAVQGPALAGGLGLVANAHVVVAAQGCSFGLTEIRIGMWPYVIFRAMAAAIGERRTVELSLTSRIFGTAEAMQWGLVHEVTPAIELDDRTVALAAQLAESSAGAVKAGLDFVNRSRTLAPDAAGELARTLRAQAFASPDFHEGVKAFLEKRKPAWPSISDE